MCILRRKENSPQKIPLVERPGCQPEHPMPVLILERSAKIFAPFLGALSNNHPKMAESPILLAPDGVKKVVILSQFPENGGFTVPVMPDLRSFDFEEKVVGIFVLRFRWVGQGEVSVRMDGFGLEVLLLPVELQSVPLGERFEVHVEKGDLKLVVKRSLGVFIERLAAAFLRGLVRESIDITHSLSLEVEIRKPIDLAFAV